jgi:formylglycine-generating enzyme required for sulfatase activity
MHLQHPHDLGAPRRAAWHLAAIVVIAGSLPAGAETPGLVAQQPAEGRYVQTARGYMVPYTMRIPGTSVEFEMVPVPGGTFRIGSPESEADREEHEGPQFEVAVEPFWIGKHEVTWAEYKLYMSMFDNYKKLETRGLRVVNDGNRVDAVTAPSNLYDPTFTFEKGEKPRLPAVSMTQFAAKQYTKWLSGMCGQFYRLPSEAEWEYACRAGTTTAFFFGDDAEQLGDYAWFVDNSDDTPHEVGQKKPNPWGLHDVHGNVAEWCLDQLLKDGYAPPAAEPVAARDALAWPTKLMSRAIRGGAWDLEASECRAAARMPSNEKEWRETDPNTPKSPWWLTDGMALSLGMRVIRPLDEPAGPDRARYWEADLEVIRDAVQQRLKEGRGALGTVDGQLPADLQSLSSEPPATAPPASEPPASKP